MTSLPSGQLTPPLMDDLQYTTYISPDTPLLTTFTYMDGKDVKKCFTPNADAASFFLLSLLKLSSNTSNAVMRFEIITNL